MNKIIVLYTNIGRGHPFYLDGIMEAMVRSGKIQLIRREVDVFELSKGLSNLGWRFAEKVYSYGSSSGILGKAYSRLRGSINYNKKSVIQDILGRNLKQMLYNHSDPLIVAHPSLAGIFKGRKDLIYQHGELIVPEEAIVHKVETIIVPTLTAAEIYYRSGYNKDQVFISGLCIEPALVKQAEDSYTLRSSRLIAGEPLTGAFFSSGAEPKDHISKIVDAAVSFIYEGGRPIIFAKRDGRLLIEFKKKMISNNLRYNEIVLSQLMEINEFTPLLVPYNSRRDENALVAKLFNLFDFFVAPPHERTNWAMGLGIPIFSVYPLFGSFAPLNQKMLTEHNVSVEIKSEMDARKFGQTVHKLNEKGELVKMAEAGWGRYKIDGFHTIANWLQLKYGDS